MIARARPVARAAIGLDCAIGKDGAGIAGLWYYEALGVPAAAADVANRLAWRWIRESRFPEIPGLVNDLPESHVTGSLWRAVWRAHRVLGEGDRALAALTRALKLQNRAARVGFDWPGPADVLKKIAEESHELVDARDSGDHAHLTEEFGDLLFVMANLARHLDIDPEEALRMANAKFTRRFRAIEAALAATGRRPEDSNLAEMDTLWNDAKAAERA